MSFTIIFQKALWQPLEKDVATAMTLFMHEVQWRLLCMAQQFPQTSASLSAKNTIAEHNVVWQTSSSTVTHSM